MLWAVFPGITNSSGTLVVHIEGNLLEFIGCQLGAQVYSRNREMEFAPTSLSADDLLARLASLRHSIPLTLAHIPPERMKMKSPEDVFKTPLSVEDFLTLLYGHLNWDLGQTDILRRAPT